MFKSWNTWISVRWWAESQGSRCTICWYVKKAHSKVISRQWVIFFSSKKRQIQVIFCKYLNKASTFPTVYTFPLASSCCRGTFLLQIFLFRDSRGASAVRDACQERASSAVRAGLARGLQAESGEAVFCVQAPRGSGHDKCYVELLKKVPWRGSQPWQPVPGKYSFILMICL